MWHYLEYWIGYIKAVLRKDQSFDQPSQEVSNITIFPNIIYLYNALINDLYRFISHFTFL